MPTSNQTYLTELHNLIFSDDEIATYFEENTDYTHDEGVQAVLEYQNLVGDSLKLYPSDDDIHAIHDFGAKRSPALTTLWTHRFNYIAPVKSDSQGFQAFVNARWLRDHIKPDLTNLLAGDEELAEHAIQFHDHIVRKNNDEVTDEQIDTPRPGLYRRDRLGIVCLLDVPSHTPRLSFNYCTDGLVLNYIATENESRGHIVHEFTLVHPYDTDTVYATGVSKRLHNPMKSELCRWGYECDVPEDVNPPLLPSFMVQTATSLTDTHRDKLTPVLTCERCECEQDVDHGRVTLLPEEQPVRSAPDRDLIQPIMMDLTVCTDCLTEFCENTMGLSRRQAQYYLFCMVLDYGYKKAAELVTRSENDGDPDPEEGEVPVGSMKSAGNRLKKKRDQARSLLQVMDGEHI